MLLEGKAAVVTGASRGVGRATAIQFAQAGCAVLVNYSTSKADAESVVEEIRGSGGTAIPYQADVSDDAQVRAMIDALRNQIDVRRVLFELGGPWISGTTLHAVYDFKKFLIQEFGPDVNMANIKPDDVLDLETNRCGLGVAGVLPSQRRAGE